MIHHTLQDCIQDLEQHGQLQRIAYPLSATLEIAAIQRRAFACNAPALLFTQVKGCKFPMLGNLFGTMERTQFIFRHSLRRLERLFASAANPAYLLKHPLQSADLLRGLYHSLPRCQSTKKTHGTVLENECHLTDLPQLISWPKDGGAFITLPQVYSEDPKQLGFMRSNLGMYRIQLSGNNYLTNTEAGMHYQIHRGIGQHHTTALAQGQRLPVTVWVGGPPALTVAAVMPLPEGIPELCFANVLAGHRIPMFRPNKKQPTLPISPAQADFCIQGYISTECKPEGPFGDHLGYYSLQHDFPLFHVERVLHRTNAIWPFTTVGRPPQEDTIFGDFIHQLTSSLVPTVFKGVHEVNAVDAAGVHPLLLAIGSERYTPYENERSPRELLTQGFNLLGSTQTSLAKYLLLTAKDDAPALHTKDYDAFFTHMLERTDFTRDLHFLPQVTMDTLDYSGSALHQGSKLLWVAAGAKKRTLATQLPSELKLPAGISHLHYFRPGILLCSGPKHTQARGTADPYLEQMVAQLSEQQAKLTGIGLLIVVDDPAFASRTWENFLWTSFTRSDPATDCYGVGASTSNKHWGCRGPCIIDARIKRFHAPPLEEDPEISKKIDALTVRGGPLHGILK